MSAHSTWTTTAGWLAESITPGAPIVTNYTADHLNAGPPPGLEKACAFADHKEDSTGPCELSGSPFAHSTGAGGTESSKSKQSNGWSHYALWKSLHAHPTLSSSTPTQCTFSSWTLPSNPCLHTRLKHPCSGHARHISMFLHSPMYISSFGQKPCVKLACHPQISCLDVCPTQLTLPALDINSSSFHQGHFRDYRLQYESNGSVICFCNSSEHCLMVYLGCKYGSSIWICYPPSDYQCEARC